MIKMTVPVPHVPTPHRKHIVAPILANELVMHLPSHLKTVSLCTACPNTYRKDIVGLILAKELIMVDPAQNKYVKDLCLRSLPKVPAKTPMYDLLRLFQTGKSHMALIVRPRRLGGQEVSRIGSERLGACEGAGAGARGRQGGRDWDRVGGMSMRRSRAAITCVDSARRGVGVHAQRQSLP